MRFKLLYTLQILFLNTIFVNGVYQCVNCNALGQEACSEKRLRDTCVIDSDSGYSCGDYKYKKLSARFSDWSSPDPTDDLEQCIPEDLNITETSIEICCVWSRSLGCQILVKPGNEYTCGTCRGTSKNLFYNNLMPCPCKSGSPIQQSHNVNVIFLALQPFFLLNWDFILKLVL